MTTWTYDDGSTMSDDGGVIRSTDAPAGNLLSDLWNPNRAGMVSSKSLGANGSSWESWIQSAATGLIGGYVANKQASNNFELEKLKLQQRGSTGQFFVEGQPTGGSGGGLAISGPMLLIGGAALLAVLMMKD